MENKIFSKIRNTRTLYLILIIGIMVMLFSSLPKKPAEEKKLPEISEEERLETLLSKIDGVGKVDVVVTYYGSGEKNIAYETKQSRRTGSQSEEESTDRSVVLSDGSPFVTKESYPEVKGVVVIAEGAKSAEIREEILNAVVTAMGIAAHRVCIL